MKNQKEHTVRIENSIDRPIIEEFPSLSPLLEMDGSEVSFTRNNIEYVLSSLQYIIPDDVSPRHRIVFGLWQKQENNALVPLGILEYGDHKNQNYRISLTLLEIGFEKADIDFSNEKLLKFRDLSKLSLFVAMKLDEPSRRKGLGMILLSTSLAVLQAIGVGEVSVFRDITKSISLKFVPNDTEGLFNFDIAESFYTKYSTEFKKTGKEEITFPTTLSSAHIDCLYQVFLKKLSLS